MPAGKTYRVLNAVDVNAEVIQMTWGFARPVTSPSAHVRGRGVALVIIVKSKEMAELVSW